MINPHNPSGFDEVIRYDGFWGAHYNKVTEQRLMPRIHDKMAPGGWPTSSLYEVAMNSLQSHRLAVGSMVNK